MSRPGKPAIRHVAAVERALAVLDAVAELEDAGTNAIARRSGVNASTVSRLLATLAAGGLVRHVEETGRYRLGARLVQLGSLALGGLDLREIARPRLVALAAETGETSTLSVPGDPDAITIDFVQSASSVQSVARVGRPSVRACDGEPARSLLAFGGADLPWRDAPSLHGPYDRRSWRATSRARSGSRARVRRGCSASARPTSTPSPRPCAGARGELVAILGVQGPAARFDRAGRRPRATRRCSTRPRPWRPRSALGPDATVQ